VRRLEENGHRGGERGKGEEGGRKGECREERCKEDVEGVRGRIVHQRKKKKRKSHTPNTTHTGVRAILHCNNFKRGTL